VQQRRPARQPLDRCQKLLELPFNRAVRAIRGVKLCVASLERRRVDCFAELVDFIPADAGAAHAGVDFQVKRMLAAGGPLEDAAGIAERGRELQTVVFVEQLRAGRHEDENRPRDPGGAELRAFLDRRDAVAPRVQRFQCPGYSDGSDPVGVGFDDGEEPCARGVCHSAGVFDEGSQVHFNPGSSLPAH